MTATGPKPAKRDEIRKPSWLYEDVAHQIILPHQLAAIVFMRYLAKCANDSGSHYVGRAVICADCGLSADTFNRAKNYLRTLGILTWIKGHGNQHSEHNIANTYQLHIKAMQLLVKAQGVFIPATLTHTGPRLLFGDALTAQVKLITTINEDFAATGLTSATTDYSSAATDFTSATTDNRSLTLCNIPSANLPSVRNPLNSSAPANFLLDESKEALPVTRDEAPTSVAPLRPIISRSAHCAHMPDPPASKPDPRAIQYLELAPENCGDTPGVADPVRPKSEADWRKQPIQYFSDLP